MSTIVAESFEKSSVEFIEIFDACKIEFEYFLYAPFLHSLGETSNLFLNAFINEE
jgi:hypothetical protein